jgi:hypothetical protein
MRVVAIPIRGKILSTAQCLHNNQFVGGVQHLRECVYLFAVHEDSNVTSNSVLFVDHAKADSRILSIEIDKNGGESVTIRLGIGPGSIGTQGARDMYFHRSWRKVYCAVYTALASTA